MHVIETAATRRRRTSSTKKVAITLRVTKPDRKMHEFVCLGSYGKLYLLANALDIGETDVANRFQEYRSFDNDSYDHVAFRSGYISAERDGYFREFMKSLLCVSLLTLIGTTFASAHEGHSHAPSPEAQQTIERLNTDPSVRLVVMQRDTPNQNTARPAMAGYFDPFRDKVKVRFDNQYLYVESDGIPDHSMMIGITAWQQQVPLPQPYTGDNAWRIPLNPVPASRPMSAKTNFFRGAIALAVNGVPIFNPIKNDGRTDTLVAGELDQWGGHCGRGDDYHYHIAPVHLEKIVGKGKPLAVALDGFPIYGYADADGSMPTDLDWLNGHKDADGNYHYHATKHYPYINGGFYGEVVERGGQVDPQPRAQGVRPALPPLRGARITRFSHPKPNLYNVAYDVYGEKRAVSYTIAENGSIEFRFISEYGTKTETYTPRPRDQRRPRDRRPPPPPPRKRPR